MSIEGQAAARRRVVHAQKKIDLLREEIGRFIMSDPVALESRFVGNNVEVVAQINNPLPDQLSYEAGSIIHDLRSAFDNLVHSNVHRKYSKICSFPVPKNGNPVESKAWADRVKQAIPGDGGRALRLCVVNLEPWEGGYHQFLWELNELDNSDKHRVPIMLAASVTGKTQTTRAHVLNTDQARLLGGPGFGIRIEASGFPGQSFYRDGNRHIVPFDAELTIEYDEQDVSPVTDGGVLHRFTRSEWVDIRKFSPRVEFIFATEPLKGERLLPALDSLANSCLELLDGPLSNS